jgi:SanA protein
MKYRNYFKYSIFSLAIIFVLLVVVFVISYTLINVGSSKYIYNDVNKLPHAQVAVIPGAAILLSGDLSPVLRDRVDMAIAIYQKGIVKKILVTGDNGSLEHNEVNPTKNYLLKKGIPEQDIFLDHAGFDTYSSMYRARDVFLMESMIVVSQAFHLPRAVYIARHLGITTYGMVADRGHYLFYNSIREMFADVKALGNLLFDRQPKYLGKVIPIMGETVVGDTSTSTSPLLDMIRVLAPAKNELIKSPFVVKGEARGNWYFEASFPVKIFDANGKQLGSVVAQAKSDWMTTDFVPFEAMLQFDTSITKTGTVVFQKDNPSGLPENDQSISIPILFFL